MWEIFEELLNRDGVSIADVSRATGISQSVFSNWKRRNSRISAENAKKIAQYFNVTVGFLFGTQEDENTSKYYDNAVSELIAQQMYDDPQLHALFHVKRNIDVEKFKTFYDMIVALYKKEHPEDNYDFDSREPS